MKDGDIYTWRFKPEVYKSRDKYGTPYHCKSLIAVANKDGKLYDTFWGLSYDSYCLTPDECELTFQGNPEDMTVIQPHEYVFYRPEDLVDMRHSNSFNELIYVKPGCARNADVMREYYKTRIDDADREIRSASHRIEECNGILAKLATGDTDGCLPVWTKHR